MDFASNGKDEFLINCTLIQNYSNSALIQNCSIYTIYSVLIQNYSIHVIYSALIQNYSIHVVCVLKA